MWKTRITAILIFILAGAVGFFVYGSEPKLNAHPHRVSTPAFFAKFPFKLGLDLSGGAHLVYKADITQVPTAEVADSMAALRDVIERRINIFGVSEPVIQVQNGGLGTNGEQRLIVDLPGVTNISEAEKTIGQTPLLEFKTENPNFDPKKPQAVTVGADGKAVISDPYKDRFINTNLTGKYLKRAALQFDPNTNIPVVSIQFDDKGTKLFEEITKANVGKTVAIFLDGAPISAPTVREAITGGQAVISGDFTPKEAKQLVGRLNSGALPVPISLISTQTIGPVLGENAVTAGVKAGIIAFLVIGLFFILWYRFPGLIAVIALTFYVAIVLVLFKLIPVVLTAAGLAGFIISLGIAVDANVLIFERLKEEMRNGRTVGDAIKTGFSRAWLSIRDSNTSTIITAIILFWFGSSLIKGFALTLGIGVLISMLSAILFTRLFLFALNMKEGGKVARFFFSSGLGK